MCGEELLDSGAITADEGSPPRVRGRDHVVQSQDRQERITPACAGKSSAMTPNEWRAADHPRVCGEEIADNNQRLADEGSPPRVRGRAAFFVF